MDVTGFDWDRGNRSKCQKHGVSLAEIEYALRGAPHVAPDLSHSSQEDRFIAAGRNGEGRGIFVAFTFRRKGRKRFIRPVSARYMHRKESDAYEKESSPHQDR